MNNTNTIAAETISTIGHVYGRTARVATMKEMALASNICGSDDGMLIVEKKTGQAWKWSNHFNVWTTMIGWTGCCRMVNNKFRAYC